MKSTRFLLAPATMASGPAIWSTAPARPAPQGLLRRAADTLARWLERSRLRREIEYLDPHLMKDVGLTHGQLLAEANKPFWRA